MAASNLVIGGAVSSVDNRTRVRVVESNYDRWRTWIELDRNYAGDWQRIPQCDLELSKLGFADFLRDFGFLIKEAE